MVDTTTGEADVDNDIGLDSFVFLTYEFWLKYVTGAAEILIGCIIAFIIFGIFYIVFGLIVRIVSMIISNPERPVDPTVRPFVITGLKMIMWLQVIPVIFTCIYESLGASVLNIISNVTLSVGLALRPMVENFVSGLYIALVKPYGPGDMVVIDGLVGKVREVRALHTILDEPDGDVVFVPNAKVLGAPINNYSECPHSRIDVGSFGLEHSADLDHARAEMIAAFKTCPEVLEEPPPNMIVTAITPTSVVVAARIWIIPTHRPAVPFLVRELVLKRFKSNGVPISCWHSNHVVASAVASLQEAGFPKGESSKAKGGGGQDAYNLENEYVIAAASGMAH